MSDPDEELQSDRSMRTQADDRPRERPDPYDDDHEAPINPNWRERNNRRTTARRSLVSGIPNRFPTSAQEIPQWLQDGGWKIVAAAAVLLIILLMLVLWMRPSEDEVVNQPEFPTQEELGGAGGDIFPVEPQSIEPEVEIPPQPLFFVVSGTEEQGLFLRADTSTSSQILETLPEGTRVEQIGDDFHGPDRIWRPVRAPSGQEGWVAIEWLQPAQ
jgi:Bacterial SH3 domain.